MSEELLPATTGAGALDARRTEGLSIESAFAAVVGGQVKQEHLAVMKELLAMDAERKFNAAFSQMQSELPVIVAESVIPNRGKYQRYEDIMQKDGVAAILSRNGFSVSYSQDFREGRIIVTCFLSHAAGHTRPTFFSVRTGGKADSDTQADCKASTTAKRNAFCAAVNVTIRQDCLNEEDDAGIEGDPNKFITPEQAFELERRAQMVHADIAALLAYAKAAKFSEIQTSRFDELDTLLARKEAKASR
jgi:hypothetical protein